MSSSYRGTFVVPTATPLMRNGESLVPVPYGLFHILFFRAEHLAQVLRLPFIIYGFFHFRFF